MIRTDRRKPKKTKRGKPLEEGRRARPRRRAAGSTDRCERGAKLGSLRFEGSPERRDEKTFKASSTPSRGGLKTGKDPPKKGGK